MGWKNWSYWSRGGVIGLVLGFVIHFVLIPLEYAIFGKMSDMGNFSSWAYIFLTWPILMIDFGVTISTFEKFMSYLLTGIYLFLLGALIGLIIGKIKSRKEVVK